MNRSNSTCPCNIAISAKVRIWKDRLSPTEPDRKVDWGVVIPEWKRDNGWWILMDFCTIELAEKLLSCLQAASCFFFVQELYRRDEWDDYEPLHYATLSYSLALLQAEPSCWNWLENIWKYFCTSKPKSILPSCQKMSKKCERNFSSILASKIHMIDDRMHLVS